MDYSFSIEHAQKYGLHEAILLRGIIFWIRKNKANKKHHHDGRTWTYNTGVAWAELFPFLTKRQVRSALDNLREQGVILVANYNKTAMDRTLWYALQDESLLEWPICHVEQIDLPPEANGSAADGQSLISSLTSKKSSKKSTAPSVAGSGHHEVMQGLEKIHGQQYANYKREGKALKMLLERVEKMYPGKVAGDLVLWMGRFLSSLSDDKFWKTVPVSPSSLLSHWDRLYTMARAKAGEQDWEHMSSPMTKKEEA